MAGIAKKWDFRKFYRETKAEIKKVSWPNRKELIQHTEVVVMSILIIGGILSGFDFVFGQVLLLITK